MASRTSRPTRPSRPTPPSTPSRKRTTVTRATPDFGPVFTELRRLLRPYARRMAVKHDAPGIYYLESTAANRYGEAVFFGAVRTGKRYVSYHLMPVYVFPALAKTLSPALKRRMQGKACFHFRTVDRALFGELKELTARGYEQFVLGGVFAR